MNVINNPPENWMRRMREGNTIWMVKEGQTATVVSPFLPEAGHRTGRIFLRFQDGRTDYWFVSEHGNGIDGSPILRPLEGNLPENEVSLGSDEAETLKRKINDLEIAIAEIKIVCMLLMKGMGVDIPGVHVVAASGPIPPKGDMN